MILVILRSPNQLSRNFSYHFCTICYIFPA